MEGGLISMDFSSKKTYPSNCNELSNQKRCDLPNLVNNSCSMVIFLINHASRANSLISNLDSPAGVNADKLVYRDGGCAAEATGRSNQLINESE